MRIELKYLKRLEPLGFLLYDLDRELEDKHIHSVIEFLQSVVLGSDIIIHNFLLALDLANFLGRKLRFGFTVVTGKEKTIAISTRPLFLYPWLINEVDSHERDYKRHVGKCSICGKYQAEVSEALGEVRSLLWDSLREVLKSDGIEFKGLIPVSFRKDEIWYSAYCLPCGWFANVSITLTLVAYLKERGKYIPCHNADNCILGLYNIIKDAESYCSRVRLTSKMDKWIDQGYIDTDDIQLCSKCRKLLEG